MPFKTPSLALPETRALFGPDAASNDDRLFPMLTAAQIERCRARGRCRRTSLGEVLVEVGDKAVSLFVVTSGGLQVLQPAGDAETLIVTYRKGQFSGEANLITGRQALTRARVSEPGDVIELGREQLLTLVQTDAELSEILLRAFTCRDSQCQQARSTASSQCSSGCSASRFRRASL